MPVQITQGSLLRRHALRHHSEEAAKLRGGAHYSVDGW